MAKRTIISEQNCPRCNAWAFLRVEYERGEVCFVYIVCNKCKLHRYQFMTTKKAMRLLTRRDKILKELSKAVSEAHKNRLRGRLDNVQRQIRESKIGIGAK